MNRIILIPFSFILFFMANACTNNQQKADTILFNATIYKVDSSFSTANAMAISGGKIIAIGNENEIRKTYQSDQWLDMGGKFVYPGFIDAHSHFLGFALSLRMAQLNDANSFEEVISIMKEHAVNHAAGWLVGRGWDQNRWPGKEFPDNKLLNHAFPETSVVLIRVDGHAVIANQTAMNELGILDARTLPEGEAIMKGKKLTGVFLENTADRFKEAIPPISKELMINLIKEAQKNCFMAGLTSVCDAGLDKNKILMIDSLQQSGELDIRIYAMLNPTDENLSYFVKNGVYQTDRLNVRSVKLYADGALGSRGARLLEPYNDMPGHSGIWVHTVEQMQEMSKLALDHGYQMCIHCIGDAAVRRVLQVYGTFLPVGNDYRWRIEHAQVVHPDDFELFGRYNIIPSMQSTHATSDMNWATSRVGEQRIQFAYSQQSLLAQNGWLPNGTDFPIEDISPIHTFYAAVARKDLQGYPENGFLVHEALSREQALRSITIWAAKAAFEEEVKGSLEPGKWADFVILDQDLMHVSESSLPAIKVEATYMNGKRVY